MNEVAAQLFGGQTMVARLRRVLVRAPGPGSLAHWSQFAWRAAPDPGRLLAEHEQFCNILSEFGAEVVVGQSPVEADPDAIYVHDPGLISDEGAIVLRPGKELVAPRFVRPQPTCTQPASRSSRPWTHRHAQRAATSCG